MPMRARVEGLSVCGQLLSSVIFRIFLDARHNPYRLFPKLAAREFASRCAAPLLGCSLAKHGPFKSSNEDRLLSFLIRLINPIAFIMLAEAFETLAGAFPAASFRKRLRRRRARLQLPSSFRQLTPACCGPCQQARTICSVVWHRKSRSGPGCSP